MRNRIKKAIDHISQARARAADHDSTEVDDIVADTFAGLW